MGREGPQLRRQLGLAGATALALGAIIGAGIFVTLGEAAQSAGLALPAAILLAAGAATLNGLSSAELGVAIPRAGGAYEFGYQLLTPPVGFAAGWLFLLAATTASTTYTLTFANYLQPLFPGFPLRLLAIGLGLAVLAVNVAGAQLSGRVNALLVIVKIGVLVAFVSLGLTTAVRAGPEGAQVPPPGGVLQAAALFFFAFTGYARPVTVVEEVRNPRRDLPRAVIAALAVSTALYLMIAVVALRLLGAAGLASSPAPLRQALAGSSLAWAPDLMSVGAFVATATVLLTELWGLSRLAFAMARRGDLPRALSVLTARGVPLRALLLLGSVVILLAATADLTPVLAASSLSLLLYYAITNLAALRLPPSARLYPPAVPALGFAACLSLALSLPAQSLLVVAGALAVGLALYLVARRRRAGA
ncbi:MAG: APC family permease [Anaerolineae bacterium]|nr:APC family permease [Anaerolineae bacterium]